eukprot:5557452-Pyramimonas_sp.AAC.1
MIGGHDDSVSIGGGRSWGNVVSHEHTWAHLANACTIPIHGQCNANHARRAMQGQCKVNAKSTQHHCNANATAPAIPMQYQCS